VIERHRHLSISGFLTLPIMACPPSFTCTCSTRTNCCPPWRRRTSLNRGRSASPVARLSVNRASMTGRGLRRSDGPRCCRFLASAPWPKNRLRIRPTDVRLVGPISAESASDSLKPSGAHLATKARFAPIGDRTRIRLWGTGHCLLHCSMSSLSKAVSRPLGGAAHEVLGT
jgi:hypothetical protein